MAAPFQVLPRPGPASWYGPVSQFIDSMQQNQQAAQQQTLLQQQQAQKQQDAAEYAQGPIALQRLLTMPPEQQQQFISSLPAGSQRYIVENYDPNQREQDLYDRHQQQVDQQREDDIARRDSIMEMSDRRVNGKPSLRDMAFMQQPDRIKSLFAVDPTKMPEEPADEPKPMTENEIQTQRREDAKFNFDKEQAARKAAVDAGKAADTQHNKAFTAIAAPFNKQLTDLQAVAQKIQREAAADQPNAAKYQAAMVMVQNQIQQTIGKRDTAIQNGERAGLYKLTPTAPPGAPPAAKSRPSQSPQQKPVFLKTATNPKTGQQVGFDGKQWLPIQ